MRFPGFVGPSYTLQSVIADCQAAVNLYPELNALGTGKEGEPALLAPTPGLRRLLTLAGSPLRALYMASNGQLFAVGGAKLYRISSSWVATELGTLNTTTGRVSIADNGSTVVLVDGTYGYVWTIGSAAFAVITSANFYAADQVTYQDGYYIFNRSGTGNFFISGLNATTFDALDIATAEAKPDNVMGVISSNQQLHVFGTQTLEVYYDSGDTFPFTRIQGAVVSVGCGATHSIAEIPGQGLMWLGGDSTGTGIIYQLQGFQAKRVSTSAIENEIRGLTSTQIAAATAWVYQQGGHIFYILNIPGLASTWAYDVNTGMWHERSYQDLWGPERHRAECHTVAFGQNVVGDWETGKVYALDQDTYTDDAVAIKRIRRVPHVSKGMKRHFHRALTIDMEMGVGLSGSGQGTDPQVMLRWSDDGGKTWSNEHWASIGGIGEYKARAIFRRLGSARDRVYEVSITEPVKTVILGADLDLEEGAA